MTEAEADSPGASSSPAGDSARRTRRVAYLVLFVAFLDNFAMLPTVAPYAAHLGAGLTGVGVAVGAYSVTNLVFNVVGGVRCGETAPASTRSGRRAPIGELFGRPGLRAACVTAFVFTGAVGSLAAFLPAHVEGLGLGAGATGGMFTLFALVAAGIMLSRVVRLGDVRGMVPPTLGGLGAYAVSLALLGTGPPPAVTVASVALFGVGYGLVFPPMAGTVSVTAAPGERGTAYGLFLAFFSLGFVAVPPLGGAVGDTTPFSPFVVAVAACLLGGAVEARCGRRRAR